ncbi:MAG: hypothetical protein IJI73_02860 [Kiritimatiellae bacterium]|nr:hypothetical protein [Kiritimatiellia bacterium]
MAVFGIMKPFVLAVAISSAAVPALRAETVRVAIEDWIAVGTGFTNGWTLANIDSYSDGSVRFRTRDSVAVSPRFRKAIVEVRAAIRCSNEATRFLAFGGMDEVGATVVTNRAAQAPSADSCREQRFTFRAEDDVRRLRIFFTDLQPGSQSQWGFNSLEIDFDDATERIDPPSGLSAEKVTGWSFTGTWSAVDGAASYLASVFRTSLAPPACTTNAAFAFPTTRSDRRQAHEITASVPDRFPGFGGRALYEPAMTANGLQIGAREKPGLLTYGGMADYTGLTLCLRARRPEGRDDGCVMPLYWIDGTETNTLSVLTIDTEPTDYFVPLSHLPAGAEVAISSTTNLAKSGRVLLDGMSFVSGFVPAHTVTNFVRTGIPAAACRVRVHGLERATEYSWFVTAVAESGIHSIPSEGCTFTTTDEAPPPLTVRPR